MHIHELIAIGLGAMGSATVFQAASRDLDVLGIDQFAPPHHFGSTHGGSRIIREAYYEGNEYNPMLRRAYELWAEIEAQSGAQLLQTTGGLFFGPEQALCVQGSLKSAIAYNVPHEYLNAGEIRERFPFFEIEDDWYGVLDKRAAILHPERCIEAQLALAENAGAKLRLNEKVEDWQVNSDYVEVKTDKGVYRAKEIIITTNAWAKPLSESLGIALNADRVVQYWVEPIGKPEDFGIGKVPIWLMETGKNIEFYGFPYLNEEPKGMKMALYPIGDSVYRHIATPWDIDREISQLDHDEIRDLAKKFTPSFNGEFIQAKTCMHVNTPDMHPVIGRHPAHDKVWLSFGFSGHGFKFSNVVGEMMVDLVKEGKSKWWVNLFDPKRFNTK